MNNLLKLIVIIIVLSITSFMPKEVLANNLSISNFSVYSADTSSNRITFTADIRWDNGWRNTVNHDAVWVFLKFSTDAGATWFHASMASNGVNPPGFSIPYGFEVNAPSDEKGYFLAKADLNAGTANAENIQFVWDYGQDGLSDSIAMASTTINKLFGIEMVQIPNGTFYVGDGSSTSDFRFKQGSSDNDPWYIQNENAITTTNSSADGYYYQSSGASGESINGSIFTISTSFPKGFQSFYIMKYELTEGQWVSFFNTLTSAERSNHDITSSSEGGKNSDSFVVRNSISWDASSPLFPASSLRSDRPVSYISWPDLCAYADWAGLRPMTEFEFEKSARGVDISPIANEYAWSTITINGALANEIYPNTNEAGTEQLIDGSANINNNSLGWASGDGRVGGVAVGQSGPLRAGIFAESSTSRITSGAGYYGNMELSGNLYEMVVSVGRNDGRSFLGTHGDGVLSVVSGYEGNATNADWPGINGVDSSRGVTGTVGSGYRGGDFQSTSSKHFQISNRTNASRDPDSLGYSQRYDSGLGIFQGGRLVRTAP